MPYLIFYQSSHAFADASGRWLEDLYRRLLDAFRKHEMAVNDTEFPLVAVIYRTERDFRASKRVDPEVQAVSRLARTACTFTRRWSTTRIRQSLSALRKPQRSFMKETPGPAEHRGPSPTECLADLAGGGCGKVLFHPASARKGGKPTWMAWG